MAKWFQIAFIWFILHVVQCRKNVLFIISDDLRPQLNSWEGPDFPEAVSPPMVTPNLDALASKSLQFTRAFCQYALCGPSRASMLTGRRPDTTKIYGLDAHWRDVGGNFTSLPQYFKNNGYKSIGIGKVYHQTMENHDPISWTEDIYIPPDNDWFSRNVTWTPVDPTQEKERPLPDDLTINYALERLDQIAQDAISGAQPFFMAVGLFKPHLPFNCPSEYYDLYPPSNINFPSYLYSTIDLPDIAKDGFAELQQYMDIRDSNYTGEFNETMDPQLMLDLRRGYYACISYIDSLTGKLIDKIDDLGLSDNTVITFVGDHGFQLGLNAQWVKNSNFQQAIHTPMIIHVPGVTDLGIRSNSFVELVDIFPTLAEAADLEVPPVCPESSSDILVCHEGWSLMPLAHNASNGKNAAFTQVISKLNDEYMGYAVRTDKYRYTEWPRYERTSEDPQDWVIDWDDNQGYELYDHTIDPEEHYNCVNNSEYELVKSELQVLLRTGWRAALPNLNTVVDIKETN